MYEKTYYRRWVMNLKVVLFFMILVFALTGFVAAQDNPKADISLLNTKSPDEPDPGIPDTVRVISSSIPSGTTSFSVPVTLYNDENIGGFSLGLTWDSPDITCDSVSFVGTRIDYVSTKPFSIDNANRRVLAGMVILFEPILGPGDGLIYTAHFSVNPAAADQVIGIDSTFYPPAGNFVLTLESGFNISPQFLPGTVTYGNPATDPTISLAPGSFDFAAIEGGANPLDQSLTITNTGAGTLNWTATNLSSWLSLDPTSGTGDGSVTLSVDITGLPAGMYYDTVTVSDPSATNDPQKAPVMLIIAEPPPTIVLNPTSFSYTITEGDGLADDELSVTNSGGGSLNWTATKNSSWLTLNPASGSGDGIITLSFSVSSLTPGTYYDTVTVSDPAATNNPQKAAIMLVVEEAPPIIVLSPTNFSYTITEGDALPDDQLDISNDGGGILNWTAANNSAWLMLDPTSGAGSGIVTMSFDVAGLSAGTYTDTITVADPAASNTPQKAAVTLVVEPPPPTISLNPTTFDYAITEGNTLADDELTITNVGGSVLNWTAGNFDTWLSLDPTSGSGDGIVTMSFDVAGLGVGIYVDTIVVSDPSATNDPQFAFVNLTVSATPIPVISVSPTSFEFFATEGGSNPGDQILSITNIGDGVLDWSVSDDADWLTLDPLFGGGNGSVTVSVDMTGLMPGVYNANITVTDPLASNSPVTVPVTFTITGLPVIVVDPTSFSYSFIEGEALADAHLMISNGGGGDLSWTVTNVTGWLTLNPTSGTGDGDVTLSFDVMGLTAGEYADTIRVSDPGAANNPVDVIVSLTVTPPPAVISLDPTEINLFAYENEAIPDMAITVANTGGGVLNWTATNQTPWVMLNPTSGSGDGSITVSFDIAGLMPGMYYDTVFVNDPAAVNTPQYTVITLTVYQTDYVEVETVTAFVGQQVEVAVDYTNATSTGQFTLPLSFDNTDVTCDSVSFVGTRMVALDESVVTIDNAGGTILIFGFSMGGPILGPGSGTIARLFFTVDGDAVNQFVPIDTTFIAPDGAFEFTYYMGDPKPTLFTSGGIDISDTPCFDFPTDTVVFEFDLGDAVPSISFPVNNTCGGVLEWSVTDGADWLFMSPEMGDQFDSVTFNIDTVGMVPGSYVTTATFESNGVGTPFEVTVILHLGAVPILALSTDMIDFGQVCMGDTVMGSFDILNAGYAPLDWTADADPDVVLSSSSGTAPSTVNFGIYTGTLDPGDYNFDVTVTGDGALNSPQSLTIHVYVVDCGACTFEIADVNGAQGVSTPVPVYSGGTDEVAGLQFNIAYDPAFIQPDSVTSNYMAQPTIGYADNQIHYVWDDIVNPITVAPGEAVMTLWVTPIGGSGSVSCFEWAGLNEITDVYGIPYEGVVYCGGCLTTLSSNFSLSGHIQYYTAPYDSTPPGIPGVTVEVSGDASMMTNTDGNGDYIFVDVVAGDYTITPSRTDDDPGVSVGDAVKIERHIATVEDFDSPFKLVAADVNLNNSVSVADVVLIRRYLAELDVLPSGNWTFIDSDFAITKDNWFEAPRMRQAMIVDDNLGMLDFVGVRMGDVVEMEPGQAGSNVAFTIPDLIAAPSSSIAVPILVSNFVDIGGLEIHITFDMAQVEIDSITSPVLIDPTVNALEGRAHIIWDDFQNPLTLPDGSTLAFIHFHVMPTATGELLLGFMASCESTNEVGDAYLLTLNDGKLMLEPSDADDPSANLPLQFELRQNYPNPFNPSTTIMYTVDKGMELVFEVYNVSGQVVDRIDLGYKSAGTYSFIYHGSNLASGIYTYRLAGEGVSMARQMMLIK